MTTLRQRCAGSLVGLACGDAVGTTVEFLPRGSFAPVVDMVGGGPFDLPAGRWTDDTSMALCLAESLLAREGFDAHDQMLRYVAWWRQGHLGSMGRCFDIGNTVRAALARFEANGDPFAGSDAPMTAGNGALMRLAPVVLYYFPDRVRIRRFAIDASRTTHAAPEALDAAALLAHVIARALDGADRDQLLAGFDHACSSPRIAALAAGSYRAKREDEIAGTGYAVASLEAALWCFDRTRTLEDAVLAAANLGDDADSTAAIAGQIAGAHYGLDAIPVRWRGKLHLGDEIERMAYALSDR
jgi:ADP-ribosyl-[dinitrogen reductase] hydrolase